MRFCNFGVGLLISAASSLCIGCQAAGEEPSAQVSVDFTQTDGEINRALFGIEGIAKVWRVGQDRPAVLDTFLRTNPSGTLARIETWIGWLEPANDNDDPDVTDWTKLRPEKMTRFIEPHEIGRFHAFLASLDLQVMPLYCYNTEWLVSGDKDDPVADKQEWSEFASAATTYWNELSNAGVKVRHAELWNEPNMPMFYGGTRESYFELFEVAALRMQRDHPDVMVAGPALTSAYHTDPEGWFKDFLTEVGEHADFVSHHIYHDQSKSADDVVAEIKAKSEAFRALPGKSEGMIALTETDGWFNHWPKTQYLMRRHFGFLEIQDRVLAVLHFTSLAYNELGEYVFGMITETGAPLADTYAPFWITRNLDGELADVAVTDGDGLRVVATRTQNEAGAGLMSVVVWNDREDAITATLSLKLPADSNVDTLRVDRVSESGFGIESGRAIETNESLNLSVDPGEVVAVTLYRGGERYYRFIDLNDQETPALRASADVQQVSVGDRVTVTVAAVNTTGQPAKGRLRLGGVPTGWLVEPLTETLVELAPGELATAKFAIKAETVPPVMPRMAMTAHSGLHHLNHGVALIPEWASVDGKNRRAGLPVDLIFVPEVKADESGDGDEH